MRTFLATLVAAAVLATSVVSVRLHLHVAQLRYRLWSLEQDRDRAERDVRLARADLEAAKAPRRLLERWSELRDEETPPPAPAPAPTLEPERRTTDAAPDAAPEPAEPEPQPEEAPVPAPQPEGDR